MSFWQGKRVVVTGGAGFLGSFVVERLAERGVATTRLAHGVPVGGELEYLDDGTLSAALKSRRAM